MFDIKDEVEIKLEGWHKKEWKFIMPLIIVFDLFTIALKLSNILNILTFVAIINIILAVTLYLIEYWLTKKWEKEIQAINV